MPQSGEQARRRRTGEMDDANIGPSPSIYSVRSEQAAPETDDAFDDGEAETGTVLLDPPRPPNSAVKLRPLPGPNRANRGPAGAPVTPIPRRTGQRAGKAATTAGTRASWLYNEPNEKAARRVHWLLPLGIGMIAMLLLWVVGSSVLAWGLDRYDDLRYGNPRTYQIDAVVGHGDSTQHPSHFIAMNLHGQAIVIEFPAGNPQNAMSYVVPYYIRQQGGGTGGDLTPVTVEFRDVTGDGKPDMLVHILFRTQVQTFVFINTGTKFRPPTSKDVIRM
jgi:hypothetical protein